MVIIYMSLNRHTCFNSGSNAAFKCNGYGFEFLLAGHSDRDSMYWGRAISECLEECTRGSGTINS